MFYQNDYKEIQLAASKDACKASCHFIKIIDGRPKSLGTGVFVQIDSNYFLLTAAHVFDGKQDNICIKTGINEALRLGGEIIYSFIDNDPTREKDKCDISILELNDDSVNILKLQYSFIQKDELGINHSDIDSELYSLVGFPASKSKFNSFKNSFKSNPYIIATTPVNYEVYQKEKYHPLSNVIVGYNKQSMISSKTDQTVVGPDTYGMSGCGLWFTPFQENRSHFNTKKYLVAIMTDWPIENKNILIGTRIDYFTEVLRNKFNLNIPKSKLDIQNVS